MTDHLKDKVAVITGSTSGIGAGIASAFAAQGARIIINGFGPEDQIKEQISALENAGAEGCLYSNADLSDEAGVNALMDMAAQHFGGVDILVNNAGVQHTDPVEDFPFEKWQLIQDLMLTAPFLAIKRAVPMMRDAGWGRVINIASVHGLVASPNKAAYVAAKHGLVGLSKVVALETANDPITCNSICPGWVLTPLVQKQIDKIAADEGIDDDVARVKLLSQKQPGHQFTTPEQIGDMAVFLCSASASNITGAQLSIDGGWSTQ